MKIEYTRSAGRAGFALQSEANLVKSVEKEDFRVERGR